MRAYKFLAEGGVGRFSDFAWPLPAADAPGAWVAAPGPLDDCRHGIHACLAHQLLDWIDDELWEIELDGEIVSTDAMVVAERGRLLRRVTEWDAATAQDFAYACAWRARDHALTGLRRDGLTEDADRLGEATGLDEVQVAAVATLDHSDGGAAELSALAADAVALAKGRRPEAWAAYPATLEDPVATAGAVAANLGAVVAHAAGRGAVDASGSDAAYADGVAAERAWQLAWLWDRLGLDPPPR